MKTKQIKGRRAKNMDKLIAAVRARECLWDKNYRGHRNKAKLDGFWDEVAAEVGLSNDNCRKQWKNLKDQCRKEIKKNPEHSDWAHFNKLQFIHHHFLESRDDDNGEADLDEFIKRRILKLQKRRNIDVDMDKLIDLVKIREIIWNRQVKGHHNWHKLDETWKEIAQEMGVTRDEARLKWKYLRDQAGKEMRKPKSYWEFLPKLKFLTNQFNGYLPKELKERLNDSENDDDDVNDNDEDTEQEGNCSEDTSAYGNIQENSQMYFDVAQSGLAQLSEQYNKQLEHSFKTDEEFEEFETKPIILDTDFENDIEEVRKYRKESEGRLDEDVGFFMSLVPHVKKLDPAKKLMMRMKIQEFVYNTVYKAS